MPASRSLTLATSWASRAWCSAPSGAEMSIRVEDVTLLSKSLLPLPEKFHGLKDTELRYRQRYVDLIMNPEVKRNFVLRSQFIKHVRDFLDARGFMEVETPVPEHHLRRRHGPSLHHPPQYPGHRHVYAYCHGAAAQASHCRRP